MRSPCTDTASGAQAERKGLDQGSRMKSLRKLSPFPGARSRWEKGVIFRALVAPSGCDDHDLINL
jgi:hypothetical protein